MSKYLAAKLEYSFSHPLAGAAQIISLNMPAASASFFGAKLEACVSLSAGSTTLTLTEGATATDGAATTPLNRQRLDTPPVSPITSFVATAPAGGIILERSVAAVSQNAKICTWLLKPGIKYLLAVDGTPTGVLSFGICVIPNQDFFRAGY